MVILKEIEVLEDAILIRYYVEKCVSEKEQFRAELAMIEH